MRRGPRDDRESTATVTTSSARDPRGGRKMSALLTLVNRYDSPLPSCRGFAPLRRRHRRRVPSRSSPPITLDRARRATGRPAPAVADPPRSPRHPATSPSLVHAPPKDPRPGSHASSARRRGALGGRAGGRFRGERPPWLAPRRWRDLGSANVKDYGVGDGPAAHLLRLIRDAGEDHPTVAELYARASEDPAGRRPLAAAHEVAAQLDAETAARADPEPAAREAGRGKNWVFQLTEKGEAHIGKIDAAMGR